MYLKSWPIKWQQFGLGPNGFMIRNKIGLDAKRWKYGSRPTLTAPEPQIWPVSLSLNSAKIRKSTDHDQSQFWRRSRYIRMPKCQATPPSHAFLRKCSGISNLTSFTKHANCLSTPPMRSQDYVWRLLGTDQRPVGSKVGRTDNPKT